jgi:hypothetical protein
LSALCLAASGSVLLPKLYGVAECESFAKAVYLHRFSYTDGMALSNNIIMIISQCSCQCFF